MATLIRFLPALGCTAMMLACAAMMWGGARAASSRTAAAPAADDAPSEPRQLVTRTAPDG